MVYVPFIFTFYITMLIADLKNSSKWVAICDHINTRSTCNCIVKLQDWDWGETWNTLLKMSYVTVAGEHCLSACAKMIMLFSSSCTQLQLWQLCFCGICDRCSRDPIFTKSFCVRSIHLTRTFECWGPSCEAFLDIWIRAKEWSEK